MYNNPCKWFTGSKQVAHKNKGGRYFYHFSPKACGLSRNMEMNIAFFADSKADASKQLEAMLEAKRKAAVTYLNFSGTGPNENYGNYCASNRKSETEILLRNKRRWQFIRLPRSQFYKISWADNDTI